MNRPTQTSGHMSKFNTGRNYSPEGQIIVWEISKVDLFWDDNPEAGGLVYIRFYDVTRGIIETVKYIQSTG